MSTAAILATFRPQEGDVAVFVNGPQRVSMTTLQVAEAAQLHATLGSALRLAATTSDPVAAVPGETLANYRGRIRTAVAAVVRGEAGPFEPAARFARRIAAGEADDSEPMRIAVVAVLAAFGAEA